MSLDTNFVQVLSQLLYLYPKPMELYLLGVMFTWQSHEIIDILPTLKNEFTNSYQNSLNFKGSGPLEVHKWSKTTSG